MNDVLQWAGILLLYVLFVLFWARMLAINSRLDWDTQQLQQGLEAKKDRRGQLTGNGLGPDR
jgi:hypothetical protein